MNPVNASHARVAIFDGPGRPFRLADLEIPSRLDPGELVVELSLATICGSDLHTHAGTRREPTPCVLGHEGVGTVVAAAADRTTWLGKRVTWSSTDSCGRCPACTTWRLPQKCARVFKYGHVSVNEARGLHGSYASHLVIRGGTHLVEVPHHVPDAVAASLNCSLATMANVTERLPDPCAVAVVQGAGLLGLHGCGLLRAAGVGRVIVVDPDEGRLARVAEFGGEPARSDEVPDRAADVVIEVAGAAAVVPEGLRMLRPGGHYLFVGMVHPRSLLDLSGEAVIRGCISLRGFHNYAPRHLDQAVSFAGHSTLPWSSLVSPPLPLASLDEAFALAATRRWPRVAVSTRA